MRDGERLVPEHNSVVAFAGLRRDDEVVVVATANTAVVACLIAPHVRE